MGCAEYVNVMEGVMENVELDWTDFENALTQMPVHGANV
jgi:hypothetical protein